MPRPKAPPVDTFDAVLESILTETGWKKHVLAARLNVSTKTLFRYTSGDALPPVSRRHGMVHALRDLPSPLLTRVSTSLGLSADFASGLPHAPHAPALMRPNLEAAVSEVAEKLDSGPARTRRALALFLGKLIAAEISPAAAVALLTKG